MRRRVAVIGSLVLHITVGVVVVAVDRETRDGEPTVPASTTIELVDIVAPAAPTVASRGGGGAPAKSSRAPARRSSARRAPASQHDGDTARSITSSLAEIAIAGEDRTAGDGGDGGGRGGGHGTGLGLGIGFGEQFDRVPPPPPPPPAEVITVSKARPAKLVYPARERDVADGELFVARVVVDHDGYVVGARLVRGFGGHRDDEAASLIWRFRYRPALDDAGHAIRSTLDQRFLVQ